VGTSNKVQLSRCPCGRASTHECGIYIYNAQAMHNRSPSRRRKPTCRFDKSGLARCRLREWNSMHVPAQFPDSLAPREVNDVGVRD
jgi:hypothetical protein